MRNICYFEIPADKPERAQKFYSELFGWEFRDRTLGNTPYLAIRTPEGIQGGMLPRPEHMRGIMNYVEVDSVEDAVARAGELGAKILVEKKTIPEMGHLALIEDPEGNQLGLWQIDPGA